MLRPWPFPGSEHLVILQSTRPALGQSWNSVNYADFEDWRAAAVLERIAAFRFRSTDLTGGPGEPERLPVLQFSEDFFATLGVVPMRGRLPGSDEQGLGGSPTVILSYGLWQSRFGGDNDVVGRTVWLDGEPTEVIGIMPRELNVLPAQVFAPLRPSPAALEGWRDRDNFAFNATARLRLGQTMDEARAQLEAIAALIESDYPQLRAGISADLMTLSDRIVGTGLRAILWIMLGAVVFVLRKPTYSDR